MFSDIRLQQKCLPILLMPLLLTGCPEGGGIVIGPTAPPTSVALNIEFSDTIPGSGIGGTIKVTRAVDDSDATAYIVRWGSNGVPAPVTAEFSSNYIGRLVTSGARSDVPYSLDIYVAEPPADLDIDSIMVFTSNSAGENTNGISVPLINVIDIDNAPTLHPASVTFSDTDERVSIAGTVTFQPPASEAGIASYVIRLANADGCPLQIPALGEVAQGAAYSFEVSPRAISSASYSIAVIAKNQFGEASSENCSDYAHTDPANFNTIVAGATPFYTANRATPAVPVDDDDTVAYHATVAVQGSRDERDLGTGYFVNLGDNAGNCLTPALAQLSPIGNREWQNVEINLPQVPTNATRILVSTGTECGYAGGAPHELTLGNNLGNWFQIKSTTSNRCLQTMASEPGQIPDNDGQSNELRLTACDSHNPAQHFLVNNIYASDDPNGYVIFNVVSETTGGCLWRRNNSDEQEWQVRKDCSSSELGNEIQIIARSNSNGRRDKTLAVRSTVAEADKLYSCAIESEDRLVSSWDNCSTTLFSSPSLFNFAPAGTTDSTQYAVLADGPQP